MATRQGFDIKIDSKVFERGLFAFQKQIPYAMARALTATAEDCRAALVAGLSSDFTIRTPWVEKGLRKKRADKTTLTAEIGSVDPFMLLQEEGGTKVAKKADMAQPVNGMRGDDNKGVTTVGKWPKSLTRGNKGYFVGKFASGKAFVGRKTGQPMARQRVVKGHKGPVFPKEPMKVVYVLQEKVEIKKRWDFWPVIEKTVDATFLNRAYEAMDEAIRTAR